MKKRILCAVLSVMLLASLITLPAQAAAKPAFQWLVDFTKREGLYDAANKTYAVAKKSLISNPMLQLQVDETVEIIVDEDTKNAESAFNVKKNYKGIIHGTAN